jgi:hypothetical protein
MATRLEDLEIDRIDLVDRGANPYAHVLLWKRYEPVQKHIVLDSKHVQALGIAKSDRRGVALSVTVDDRHDPEAWQAACGDAVQCHGGELWVNYARRIDKRDAVLKLAALLPTTCKRYVWLKSERSPVVALPGMTLAQAMEPPSKAYADYVAKWGIRPGQEEPPVNVLSPEAINKAIADVDKVALRKIKSAFPEQVQVVKRALRDDAISAEELAELQMLDPNGRLSLDERAMHLAARRFPSLYDGYVAAVSRGIA